MRANCCDRHRQSDMTNASSSCVDLSAKTQFEVSNLISGLLWKLILPQVILASFQFKSLIQTASNAEISRVGLARKSSN